MSLVIDIENLFVESGGGGKKSMNECKCLFVVLSLRFRQYLVARQKRVENRRTRRTVASRT